MNSFCSPHAAASTPLDGDATRLIGQATVTSDIAFFDEPVTLAGRDFKSGCDLRIERLAPYRHGVEIAPLVNRLAMFPNKQAWASGLRRSLILLSARDATLLRKALTQMPSGPPAHMLEYLEQIRPVAYSAPTLKGRGRAAHHQSIRASDESASVQVIDGFPDRL